MSKIPVVSISELLDAGVHFGHKTARWNPKMGPYIYGTRDGVHIIDLRQTAPLLSMALEVIYQTAKNGGKILFVSTKVQASEIIAEYAEKCGQFYVNHRWLGGMLTNWGTISRSIKKLDDLEKILSGADVLNEYTKKEVLNLTRKKDKLLRSLGGIRNLKSMPDLLVVIDTNKEHFAINEAKKLNIPRVAIVDTNSDPDDIQYPIPGNDDSMRAIRLYCHLFAGAVLAGLEEALVASGVDVNKVSEQGERKNEKETKKMSASKKVSRAIKMDKANEKEADSFSGE